MITVNKILELFDDLDGYESVELIQALAERGYELKINYELAKITKRKHFGIYLKGFNDVYKISCIKVCRNYGPANEKSMIGFVKWGLKDTKDFVENEKLWKVTPLYWGLEMDMKFHLEMLHKEHFPSIEFELKEMDQ
jgi:ribosomal protein L7/L12